MIHSSRLLTCLVSIALITTPAMIPTPFPSIAHAQTNSADWSDMFNQAQKLEGEDKYTEAEAIYRQILASPRPASMNDYMYYYIQVRFGQILQTQGKFTEAIEVLERVISSTANGAESYDQARRTLARIVENQQNSPSRVPGGLPDGRIEFLQGIMNRNATIAESRNQARQILTRVLESQQNAAELVTRGLQLLRNDPNTRRGYFELARGLAAQGQLANGFTFLEANFGRPLTPESALELARAAKSQGVEGSISGSGYRSRNSVRQDAIALYRQLVNRYPDQQTARAEFIELLRLAGRQDEVVALYQQQVQTNPPESRPRWELARALEENGQIQEAIAVYDQILSEGGGNPDFYMEFGALLERNQEFDRALQIYLKGIQKFPRDTTGDPQCRGLHRTAYDSLIELLDRQNRLGQILPIVEQAFPNAPAAAYRSLALSLAYRHGFTLEGSNIHQAQFPTQPNQPYGEQAEIVNQRLRERYPEAESWQGRVETWRGDCGGRWY